MNIVNTFNNKIKNLNSKIKNIMNIGFKVSFVLCLFAILLLSIYQTMYALPNLFYAGISLLHRLQDKINVTTYKFNKPKIILARLGNDAGIIGATLI